MPRNWQPPPGVAQAWQPRSAASSSVTSWCANRAPSVWTAPASSPRRGGSVTPPGIIGPCELAERGDRHHHRRQALVARSNADHAPAVRQAAHEPAQHERRIVAVGKRVEHPGRSLRAAVARVGDVRGKGEAAEPVELRPQPRARAGRPPSGPCGTRARSGVPSSARTPPSVERIRNSSRPTLDASQPMPAFCDRPNTSPEGRSWRNASVSGRAPSGPAAVVSTWKRSRRPSLRIPTAQL